MTEFTKDVLFFEKGPIGLIVLNRPKALNALSYPMIQAMTHHLEAWKTNPNIKAVLIKAAGQKAFCAGGDIKALFEAKLESKTHELPQFYAEEYQLNYMISVYPKPYIALLDGITMGGGAGISIHGRYRVGTEKLIFAMPETTIGFFPDVGGGHFLSRLKDGMGLYLGLTGEKIGLTDCLDLGLVTHTLKSENAEAFEEALISASWSDDKCFEQVMQKFKAPGQTPSQLAPYKHLIKECFQGTDTVALLACLKAHSHPWTEQIYTLLRQKSPISLSVTHQLIERAKNLDLKEELQLELVLCHHFVAASDLFEGIRALLVDKDLKPKWQFKYVDTIPQGHIESYFQAPSDMTQMFKAS